jgi:hypothetical protein
MTADPVSPGHSPTVVPLALRARVLAAIRGALAALGGMAAVIAGVPAETVFLGWVFGAVIVSIILAGDRRGRVNEDPRALPDDAIAESWVEIARTGVVPSTVGVAALTVVSLLFNPAMAGILSGILGGMAIMTMVSAAQVALAERRFGGALSLDRATRHLYVRPYR